MGAELFGKISPPCWVLSWLEKNLGLRLFWWGDCFLFWGFLVSFCLEIFSVVFKRELVLHVIKLFTGFVELFASKHIFQFIHPNSPVAFKQY